MNMTYVLFGIAIALYVMQAAGAYLQVKDFQRAIRRVHTYGNVGLGQKRGIFSRGYLVAIACDSKGYITYAERNNGLTIFSKAKPFNELLDRPLIGVHIDSFANEFAAFDKRQTRQMKGYIQAIEALQHRLYPERYFDDDPEALFAAGHDTAPAIDSDAAFATDADTAPATDSDAAFATDADTALAIDSDAAFATDSETMTVTKHEAIPEIHEEATQ